MQKYFDLVIIGAGPAGLSAALYASRAMLKTALIEKETVGGLITTTSEITNYPGSSAGETGESLAEKMKNQAEAEGCEFFFSEVREIKKVNGLFICDISSFDSEILVSKAVIAAGGSHPRMLGIPGEEEFRGRGVSYCATCDAPFFRDRRVIVVGGGDAALKEADYLTKFASEVLLVHRRDEFRASSSIVNKVKANSKIKLQLSSVPAEIKGEHTVSAMTLRDLKTDSLYDLQADGVFIFAGFEPNTEIFRGLTELDADGCIITDEYMRTSLKGLFAAGDIRRTVLRQVITAASDGAVSGVEAAKYIDESDWNYLGGE